MRVKRRSVAVAATINALAWLTVHLGVAWGLTRLPRGLFRPDGCICRARGWEREGRWYERVLRIKRWKNLLPDGALLFAGAFPKGKVRGGDRAYLERFVDETCRGEWVHWVVILFSPLFFLWNPRWAGVVNVLYGCVANLPCIFALRYNRLHLRGILARYEKRRTRKE
jgi:glycosyl-4,4'-diaponeurosporenoate acyltransferase